MHTACGERRNTDRRRRCHGGQTSVCSGRSAAPTVAAVREPRTHTTPHQTQTRSACGAYTRHAACGVRRAARDVRSNTDLCGSVRAQRGRDVGGVPCAGGPAVPGRCVVSRRVVCQRWRRIAVSTTAQHTRTHGRSALPPDIVCPVLSGAERLRRRRRRRRPRRGVAATRHCTANTHPSAHVATVAVHRTECKTPRCETRRRTGRAGGA